jgi:hypothetical protein
MFGVRLTNKDQFLKLYPDTSFSFELNSPAYLGNKVDTLQNSLVFRTKVPTDYPNDALLRYPHVEGNAYRFLKNEPCSIYAQGRVVFLGLLNVFSPNTKGEAEIQITLNTIAEIKDKSLRDFDFGNINLFNNDMTATVHDPLSHPFVFHPVWNTEAKEIKAFPKGTADEFQNLYEPDPNNLFGRVATPRDGSSATPFMRLEYVLKQLFETNSYTFENNFQTSKELRQMTMYSNQDIVVENPTFTHYDLKNAMPSGNIESFLAKICRLFGVAPYINVFEKTVEMTKLSDVLLRPSKHNWTKFLASDITWGENDRSIKQFKWKYGADWRLPSDADLEKILFYRRSFGGDPFENGVLQVEKQARYNTADSDTNNRKRQMLWRQSAEFPTIIEYLLTNPADEILLNNDGEIFEIDAHTLAMANVMMENDANRFMEMPTAKMKVSKINEPTECPLRLMLYRGLRQNRFTNRYTSGFEPFIYPLASSEDFTFLDDIDVKDDMDLNFNDSNIAAQVPLNRRGVSVNHTLSWKGEKGIYNRFHKDSLAFLDATRTAKATFYLDINELISFNFQDKVTVRSQEYLVKQIRGVLKDNIQIACDIDLVSVI